MNHIERVILESHHNKYKMLGDIRYLSNGTRKPLILFVHGFKGFKDWGHFNLIADYFAENGFVYVKFNLSHDGVSLDNPFEIEDLEAFGNNNFSIELDDLGLILDHICGRDFEVPKGEVDENNIFMIGHSRGGGLTILKAAEDPRIKAISTWAAIYDITKMWSEETFEQWEKEGVLYVQNSRIEQSLPLYYQIVLDYYENKDRLDIPRAAAKLECPWLICHGTKDETLDVSMARDLKACNKKAELLIIDGATHHLGGGHPYNSTKLLKHARIMVEATRTFFQKYI